MNSLLQSAAERVLISANGSSVIMPLPVVFDSSGVGVIKVVARVDPPNASDALVNISQVSSVVSPCVFMFYDNKAQVCACEDAMSVLG